MSKKFLIRLKWLHKISNRKCGRYLFNTFSYRPRKVKVAPKIIRDDDPYLSSVTENLLPLLPGRGNKHCETVASRQVKMHAPVLVYLR